MRANSGGFQEGLQAARESPLRSKAVEQDELPATGYVVGARTIRRTSHGVGWRWKRPTIPLSMSRSALHERRIASTKCKTSRKQRRQLVAAHPAGEIRDRAGDRRRLKELEGSPSAHVRVRYSRMK